MFGPMPAFISFAAVLAAQSPEPEILNAPTVLTFQGPRGHRGSDGRTGLHGSRGLSGSMDFKHPRPGGRGGSGGRGSNGERGGRGGNGPELKVAVTLDKAEPPRLLIQVEAERQTKAYLLDPQHATLTLRSLGGSGGWGGRGGRGGQGGQGGLGRPSGAKGLDGTSGLDGLRGPDGQGGAITVTVDPSAKPYLGALKLESPGGPDPKILDPR